MSCWESLAFSRQDPWFTTVVNSEHECLLQLKYIDTNKMAAPDYGTYLQHQIVVIPLSA